MRSYLIRCLARCFGSGAIRPPSRDEIYQVQSTPHKILGTRIDDIRIAYGVVSYIIHSEHHYHTHREASKPDRTRMVERSQLHPPHDELANTLEVVLSSDVKHGRLVDYRPRYPCSRHGCSLRAWHELLFYACCLVNRLSNPSSEGHGGLLWRTTPLSLSLPWCPY